MTEHTPGIAYLDGVRLLRGLRAGLSRLSGEHQELNRINVFPVADGDTGTNLLFTLQGMVEDLEGRPDPHAGRSLTRLADAALDHARGNSGAILAQFFQGMADSAGELATLGPREFGSAVDRGADYARLALSEPRSGTLLTVLEGLSQSLREEMRGLADFRELIEASLERLEDLLAHTPEQLDVLRRAGVVDAGAAGFVAVVRGAAGYVSEGSLRDQPTPLLKDPDATPLDGGHGEGESRFRYCTECLIEGEAIDPRVLRETLAPEGDSLVIAGMGRKVRVHIHTDTPDRLFRIAGDFGRVHGQKADDMHRQQDGGHARAGRMAIVTDSAADIPESLLESLDIHVVPVHVHFGDKAFLDKLTLDWQGFYQKLDEEPIHPTTSQPAPGEFRRMFQYLASHYDGVISIDLTGAASGTVDSARQAAARLDSDRIHVIDSRSVSAGLGLIVMEAARKARAGADAQELLELIEDSRRRTRVWGAVADLSFGVRGGRVSPLKKRLVNLLRVTPVLTARRNGKVDAGGILPGRTLSVERFARFVARRARRGKRYRLLVGHCNAEAEGRQLHALLSERIDPVEAPEPIPVGPALGAHAGPGTLVAALQEVAEREEA